MKTQPYLIRYIIVHFVPLTDWLQLPYQRKKAYHYVVAGSRTKAFQQLHAQSGCIEVAHIGRRPANGSKPLFSLLLDISISHPEAKIVYASELFNFSPVTPVLIASHWLKQHLPSWLRRWLGKWNNLLILRTFFPMI